MDHYKITFETYNKVANEYQDKFMYMDLYNDTYDYLCGLINKQYSEILEIGCGPGNITKYLLTKRPDFKIEGIDISLNMLKLAKDNNPSANFKQLDCRDISSLNYKYDAIVCGFIMPYLSKDDCAKLIEDCSKLLNPNGFIYFSTMEDDYSKSGFETTSFSGENEVYVYYHEEKYLSQYLEQCNFKLVDLSRKAYPEPDGTFLTDMIFIAQLNN